MGQLQRGGPVPSYDSGWGPWLGPVPGAEVPLSACQAELEPYSDGPHHSLRPLGTSWRAALTSWLGRGHRAPVEGRAVPGHSPHLVAGPDGDRGEGLVCANVQPGGALGGERRAGVAPEAGSPVPQAQVCCKVQHLSPPGVGNLGEGRVSREALDTWTWPSQTHPDHSLTVACCWTPGLGLSSLKQEK